MLSANQQQDHSRSHLTNLCIGPTRHAAARLVSEGVGGPNHIQQPLSSITNVLHRGEQTATKHVSDQRLPAQQKPLASQGLPKASQQQPSAAHASAPQQSYAGAACAQSQPECNAGGAAATQCTHASDRAAWQAEVAFLKRKLHKYCAILASEPGRRELPDGGLKVVTQPHSRAALPQHVNRPMDLAPRNAMDLT